MNNSEKYMNPYMAGLLLGLLLVATVFITGRGLGASGAVKSVTVAAVGKIAPQHTGSNNFYREYTEQHQQGPLMNWLVFEVFGVLVGAFISGLIAGRLSLKLEKGPRTTSRARLIGAVTGGFLWGIGSQLGRGCTSGAALSGMGVMSTGGILVMIAIFAGAYIVAWFFRKLWL